MKLVFLMLVAYLIGQLFTADIVGKWKGVDLRQSGSHNPGARNAGRILGKSAFVLVFIGDFLKSLLPMLLAKYMGFSVTEQVIVMAAVVVGHLYPIFFRFQGGKGVATFLGAFIVLNPAAFLFFALTFAVLYILIRSFSTAGLLSILLSPIFIYLETGKISEVLVFLIIVILIISKHRKQA